MKYRKKKSAKKAASVQPEIDVKLGTQQAHHPSFPYFNVYPCSNKNGKKSRKMSMIAIDVNCGGKRMTFVIRRDWVKHWSPYFRAASHGAVWKDNIQELALEDTSPKVFGRWTKWMKTCSLANKHR